jgi:hypothetical protein
MKERTKTNMSFYLDIKMIEELKIFCMYKKKSLSRLIDDLVTEYYDSNQDEVQTLNKNYHNILKNNDTK